MAGTWGRCARPCACVSSTAAPASRRQLRDGGVVMRAPPSASDCNPGAILIRPKSGPSATARPLRPESPRSDALTDTPEDLDRATGTQLLDRAVAVLKFLGQAGEGGARATAIAEAVGLK